MTSKDGLDPDNEKNQALKLHEDYTRKLIISSLNSPIANAISEYAKVEYQGYPGYNVEHEPEHNSWSLYVSQPEFECESSTEEELRKHKMLSLNVRLEIINVGKLIFQYQVTVEINFNAAYEFQFHKASAIPHEPNIGNVRLLVKVLEEVIIKTVGSKATIKECEFVNKYNYIRGIVDTSHFRKACL